MSGIGLRAVVSAVGAVVLAFVASGAAKGDETRVPFEELASAFREEHCKKNAPCTFEDVVGREYATLTLGAFRLEYPRVFLREKTHAQNLHDALGALTRMHATWIDWFGLPDDATAAARKDLELLGGWLDDVKPSQMVAAAKGDERDLFAAWKATPEVRDASERLRAYVLSTEHVALAPSETDGLRMVFAPTRLDFLRLLGFTGSESEAARKLNWVDGTDQWMQFWLGRNTVVVALEYAPWGGFDPSFKGSQPMEKIGETVLAQHVVQQATLAMLETGQPYATEGHFDQAIALNMMIATCGEAATIENSGAVGTTGAQTAPYERFVPGGNSEGGVLPAQEADSLDQVIENHWRKGRGKDYFRASLRNGQKDGAKEVKDKSKDQLAHFLLRGGQSGSKHLVHAPFFGPHAKDQEYPPGPFIIDYAEFFRAYKTAFAHWLQNWGDPTSPEASRTKFRELMADLGKRTTDVPADEFIAKHYGLPLSGKDGSSDSLEWRFLKWIGDAK